MTTEIKIRLQEWMLEKWKKSAEEDGVTLSEWIRQRCEGKNLLGTDAERAKIKEQMKVMAPVPTIAGKAAHDPEDRLPDFVADQPTEESSGSKDQDVRRYEELPVGRRGAHRRERSSPRSKSPRGSPRVARAERTEKKAAKCDRAVAPGLYCPKCDRRH